jgi:hypothetical protein
LTTSPLVASTGSPSKFSILERNLIYQCRDSILYRLVLAYFMAHDNWASQHNITIMCRVIPHIMHSFPAITRQTQDTFPHSRLAHVLVHLHMSSCIFACHHTSSHVITHLRMSSCIIVFHHASSRSIMHLRIEGWGSATGMKRSLWVWGNSAVRPRCEVYTWPIGQLLRGRTSEYGQGTL